MQHHLGGYYVYASSILISTDWSLSLEQELGGPTQVSRAEFMTLRECWTFDKDFVKAQRSLDLAQQGPNRMLLQRLNRCGDSLASSDVVGHAGIKSMTMPSLLHRAFCLRHLDRRYR